jgi:hypothetical protein
MEKDPFFIEYFFGGIMFFSLYLLIFIRTAKGLEEEIT